MLRYLATSGGPVYKVVALNSTEGDCQRANGTEDCDPVVSDFMKLHIPDLLATILYCFTLMLWGLYFLIAFCDDLTWDSH